MRRCKTRGCKSVEKIKTIGGLKFTNFALGGYCRKCINGAMREKRRGE